MLVFLKQNFFKPGFFKPDFLEQTKRRKIVAQKLYQAIIEQARSPVFYRAYNVPDTVDGRFDLILLHAYIVIAGLEKKGKQGAKIAQTLFDVMFKEMERAIREIGVGDLSVGKHMKRMMASFQGRYQAYESAIEKGDDASLKDILERNLYRKAKPPKSSLMDNFVHYVKESRRRVDQDDQNNIAEGLIDFPEIK